MSNNNIPGFRNNGNRLSSNNGSHKHANSMDQGSNKSSSKKSATKSGTAKKKEEVRHSMIKSNVKEMDLPKEDEDSILIRETEGNEAK